MNNLNSVLVEGNLVRDAVLKKTAKGTSVCNLCIATNRFYKSDTGFEKEVSFIEVATWERLAQVCAEKGKKGRGVRVVGRLKQDRWVDSSGSPRSKIYIVAEHVEFRPEVRASRKDDGSPFSEEEQKAAEEFLDANGEFREVEEEQQIGA